LKEYTATVSLFDKTAISAVLMTLASYADRVSRHWQQRANAKWNNSPSPSGVIENAEKMKSSISFC